jgi:hypothetical protein
LSLSPSPAFAPCGIPFELDDPADEPPEDCVEGLLDVVDELELEELEPHAATARVASTSRAAARRRVDLVIVAVIIAPLFRARVKPGITI